MAEVKDEIQMLFHRLDSLQMFGALGAVIEHARADVLQRLDPTTPVTPYNVLRLWISACSKQSDVDAAVKDLFGVDAKDWDALSRIFYGKRNSTFHALPSHELAMEYLHHLPAELSWVASDLEKLINAVCLA